MKKLRFILIVGILVSAGSFYQPAMAQEKTREEKQRELKMQEEIKAQKKALAEQKKAQEEIEKALEDKMELNEDVMKDTKELMDKASIEVADKYRDFVKVYRDNGDTRRRFEIAGEPWVFSSGGEPFMFHSMVGGDNERTTWDFTKSLKENSFSGDYTFDVEPTANSVVMSVNGDCKAGDIRIKIIMPSGKIYSDIVIDEFGNLNWRKSFTISEEENKDKAGAWKFKIDADKATGFFKISLQTY